MPRLFRFHRMTPVLAAIVLSTLPAHAQDRAAIEAWDLLRETLEATGLQVTAGSTGADGAALRLDDVVVRPQGAPMAMILRLPSLTIAANPDGSFRATPAPFFDLDLRDARQRLTRLQFAHDGALDFSVSESASEVRAGMGLNFGSLRITQTPGAGGKPVPGQTALEGLDIELEGFTGRIDMTIGATVGLEGQLQATRVSYDLEIDDGTIDQVSWTEMNDVSLTLSVREIPMESDGGGVLDRAFANGFGAQMTLTTGLAESGVEQDVGGIPLDIIASNESSELSLTMEDGSVRLHMAAQGLEIEVESPVMSSSGSLASMVWTGEMPLVADDRERPFRMAFGLNDLRLGQALWAMVGAPGFADDALTLALDIQGNGRWLVPLDQIDAAAAEPLAISSLALSDLTLRFGTTALTGGGQFDLAPGALAMDGPPDGTGQFRFELRGAERLLQRLSETPLLPADQLFIVRAMIGALGRSVGEDHVVSDVNINPGGQILVNGLPLPF